MRAKLGDGIYTGQTTSLFNPLTVFLAAPIKVVKGQKYSIKLHYLCGGDTLDAKIAVGQVTVDELVEA